MSDAQGITLLDHDNTFYEPSIIRPIQMGSYNKFGAFCDIAGTLGSNNSIGSGVFIPQGIFIGNNCFIGPRVTFCNDKYPPSKGKYWCNIIVRDHAVVGANVTILPGAFIGEHAKIGAGSVVTKDVPDGEVWVGNPARPIKKSGVNGW